MDSSSKRNSAQVICDYLSAHPNEGLSCLALGRADGLYAPVVAPRLEVLRQAVRAGDVSAAAAAAERMAGCGPGLTPSSDDLLCGYLALLPDRLLGQAIAEAAAGKTAAVSAAYLRAAGAGHYHEDILALLACLRFDQPGLEDAIERVASFGSCSGRDFLAGLYFGILDGGMRIDFAGST